jgi:hypothetical protein
MTEQSPIHSLTVRGLDDWVYAADVYDIARECGLSDPSHIRVFGIGLIAEALSRGLMVAGSYEEGGFVPWPCSTDEAIGRVAREWLEWGVDQPTPGAIVWLENTEHGQELGSTAVRDPC